MDRPCAALGAVLEVSHGVLIPPVLAPHSLSHYGVTPLRAVTACHRLLSWPHSDVPDLVLPCRRLLVHIRSAVSSELLAAETRILDGFQVHAASCSSLACVRLDVRALGSRSVQ